MQLLQEDLGYAEVQKYYLQLFEQEMDTRHTKLLVNATTSWSKNLQVYIEMHNNMYDCNIVNTLQVALG